MNWGRGLTLVFAAFATLIGALVYGAMHTKFELVSKEYYKDELNYQQKIDGRQNAKDAGALVVTKSADTVALELPASFIHENIKADVWFYCKINSASDRRNNIVITNGRYVFERKYFPAAEYEVRLQMEAQGKTYYYTTVMDLR